MTINKTANQLIEYIMPRGRKPKSETVTIDLSAKNSHHTVPTEVQAPEEVKEVVVEQPERSTEDEKTISPVMFEGVEVLNIIEDQSDLPILQTHYHARMADGSTKHVPKSLFPSA